MFCRNCGKELSENAKFCSGCGAPVSAPPEEPAEIPVEETPVIVEPPIIDPEPVEPTDQPTDAAGQDEPQDEIQAALDQQPVIVAAAVPEIQPAPQIQPIHPAPSSGAEAPPVLGTSKKRGGVLVILGVAAVVVIVLIVALIKLLPSGGGKEVFAYMTDDDELMFQKDLKVKTQAAELTDDEVINVFFSKDGKYIYYVEGDSYSGTGTLYRAETAKIGKKDFSPEKISPDVSPYNISLLDNGGAVYIRGSDSSRQLRWYDGKDSYKLASDVSYFTLNANGTYAYYSEYDSSDSSLSVYRVGIKDGGEKERILKDASTVYNNYDAGILVYGKSNGLDSNGVSTYDVYSQVPGGDKTKLLSDVYTVLNVSTNGTKVSISYLTAETEEHTLYDFVTDSMASSDAGASEPSSSDYKTYNSWGWTTTDWDAYYAAYEEWSEVMMRNDIRQSLKDTHYNLNTYILHRYEDGKDTVLAEGLSYAYPACSPSDGIYVYSKAEQDVSTVCDVSDLSYWSDIYERIDTAEYTWYQNVNGTESELKLDEDGSVGSLYVLNGSEVILTVYEDGENTIQAYSIGKNGLTFTSIVADDDWTDLSVGRDGKQDVIYYFTDMDRNNTYGDLVCYANGSKTTVAKEAAGVILLDGGKTVFKVEDVSYNDRSGTTECSLYVVKDGKNTRIADDVSLYNITFLDAKRVVYISDEDLYVWNGSTSEKLANDVTNFWASQQAERQVLSLDW